MAINNTEELVIEQGDNVDNDETLSEELAEKLTESKDRIHVDDIYKSLIVDNIDGNTSSLFETINHMYKNQELKRACSGFFSDGKGWINLPINSSSELREAMMNSLTGTAINLDEEWSKLLKVQADVFLKNTPEGATIEEVEELVKNSTQPQSEAKQSFKETVKEAKEKINTVATKASSDTKASGDTVATVAYGLLGLAALVGIGYAGYKAYDHFSDSGDVVLVDNETIDVF